jgi:peptide/nickel transport system ATP-binding protein
MNEHLLDIKDLEVQFHTMDGDVHAVNGISLTIASGETLGLVGETGAGKTTTALSILNLIQTPPGKIERGEIRFEGKNILEMNDEELHAIRGSAISMIFQDPMTALNPIFKVEDQIAEVVRIHEKVSKAESVKKAREMLEFVGIPAERGGDYPHQFSGGMKQRVVIAMALACSPKLLIADEPTTALDVTIQAQVLDMMTDLKKQFGSSMLLITHDLGVVAETCDKVAIMYAGEIVEYGSLEDIFEKTAHPYTEGLFNSLPSLDEDVRRLKPIRGLMPDPSNLPAGCKFHPRCPYADDRCMTEEPQLKEVGPSHLCRCHHCDKDVPLCFPNEPINEDATNLGHPISNHGNDIFGKGGDPQ